MAGDPDRVNFAVAHQRRGFRTIAVPTTNGMRIEIHVVRLLPYLSAAVGVKSQHALVATCRSVMKTRPSATTGLDQPVPSRARQTSRSGCVGQDTGKAASFKMALLPGPRHCGQAAIADFWPNFCLRPRLHAPD